MEMTSCSLPRTAKHVRFARLPFHGFLVLCVFGHASASSSLRRTPKGITWPFELAASHLAPEDRGPVLSQVDVSVSGHHHSESVASKLMSQTFGPSPGSQKMQAVVDTSGSIDNVAGIVMVEGELAGGGNSSDVDRNATAADIMMLKANRRGDSDAFFASLLVDVGSVLVIFTMFWFLRNAFPLVYSANAEITAEATGRGAAEATDKNAVTRAPSHWSASAEVDERFPRRPEIGAWGWIKASLAISIDDIERNVSLDQAMLIEFSHLSIKICGLLGFPMCLVLCPLHFWTGGMPPELVDNLSRIGMANIAPGNLQLYWLHAFIVWLVVLVVEYLIWNSKERFLERRFRWLRAMPAPRSTTVLVQNIPERHCSDGELRAFFSRMFPPDAILKVYVVRKTEQLLYWVNMWRSVDKVAQDAAFLLDKTGARPQHRVFGVGEVDSIDYYASCKADALAEIWKERQRIREAANSDSKDSDCAAFASNGFVTFTSRRDADIAQQLQYTADAREMVMSVPPDPADVRWADLQSGEASKWCGEKVGYLCVFGLYIGFMPICAAVSSLTTIETLRRRSPFIDHLATTNPHVKSILEGVGGSLALTLFLSFFPSLLVLIFNNFFVLKADAWVQLKLQTWYFWFLVIFILLGTTIGTSLIISLEQIVERPFQVFGLLADTMPQVTHFYMNFMALQWVVHAVNLTRYVNLAKYVALRAVCDEWRARELSEPEDQDYYGIGSRSARWTLNLVIAVVFSSLCPMIVPLTFVNFCLCRLIYGYLIVFTEVQKPDLGGRFFMVQLHHLQIGVFIYLILMTGVLYRRAPTSGPMCMALGALVYALYMTSRLNVALQWDKLPFEAVVEDETYKKRTATLRGYIQPELIDPPDEESAVPG